MRKATVHYDQLEVINAAKYLTKHNNIGTRNQNRSVDDWYHDILGNIKRAVKMNLDMFSTAGYTLNRFDSYYVEITVSPSFGDVILETMEVGVEQ